MVGEVGLGHGHSLRLASDGDQSRRRGAGPRSPPRSGARLHAEPPMLGTLRRPAGLAVRGRAGGRPGPRRLVRRHRRRGHGCRPHRRRGGAGELPRVFDGRPSCAATRARSTGPGRAAGADRGVARTRRRRERRRAARGRRRVGEALEDVGVAAFVDEWLAQPIFAGLPSACAVPARTTRRTPRQVWPRASGSPVRARRNRCGTASASSRAPTLLVVGAHDASSRAWPMRWNDAHRRDRARRRIPDAGHAPQLETARRDRRGCRRVAARDTVDGQEPKNKPAAKRAPNTNCTRPVSPSTGISAGPFAPFEHVLDR